MADIRLIDANNLYQKIIEDDMIQCGTTFQHVCLAIKNAPTIDAIPTEKWNELKETIIEMRDNGGNGTQQEVCCFLANLIDILERE